MSFKDRVEASITRFEDTLDYRIGYDKNDNMVWVEPIETNRAADHWWREYDDEGRITREYDGTNGQEYWWNYNADGSYSKGNNNSHPSDKDVYDKDGVRIFNFREQEYYKEDKHENGAPKSFTITRKGKITLYKEWDEDGHLLLKELPLEGELEIYKYNEQGLKVYSATKTHGIFSKETWTEYDENTSDLIATRTKESGDFAPFQTLVPDFDPPTKTTQWGFI